MNVYIGYCNADDMNVYIGYCNEPKRVITTLVGNVNTENKLFTLKLKATRN